MSRFIPAVLAVPVSFLVQAFARADVAAEPPLETNSTALVVFGVLFIGFCVGILWMTWKAGKKDQDKAEPKG